MNDQILMLVDRHAQKDKHAFHFGSTFNGDELLTLQKVQEYCRNNQNAKILYFHNKGHNRQDLIDSNFRRSVECYIESIYGHHRKLDK